MMDGPFDTSYLLICCFFQPPCKTTSSDSQRNKTRKLNSDLHDFQTNQTNSGVSTGYPHSNPPQMRFKWTLRREVHRTSNGKKKRQQRLPLWILPALRRRNW